ncbi:hypothetical protein [Mannheimia haemolytica]|uniref:hypothetical protein n=1 Tax=Mannheimia haemolytica TaxID=75985 RepID=UPI00030B9CD2|nr:hypothetical protein [Mannheimia haemolytica]AJE08367.1 hypothetical protein B824_15720 [Mannheimia haemolytica USDA-ARS-USMARC-184]KYL11588.1 hypothetical protein AC568_01880 [Mannheimia haemolytica]UFK42263.1 hypothetical protein LO774_11210 [Mannheimia haemolytica]UQX61977.1 hypothetical protein M3709_07225 [Mannheimia haemolytica]HDL1116485.1 hypothetical protein [Mannheimia haemolytica]
MDKLTKFQALQLATQVLPKEKIQELWIEAQAQQGNVLQLEQLYRRYIKEMFLMADLILEEQSNHR